MKRCSSDIQAHITGRKVRHTDQRHHRDGIAVGRAVNILIERMVILVEHQLCPWRLVLNATDIGQGLRDALALQVEHPRVERQYVAALGEVGDQIGTRTRQLGELKGIGASAATLGST
ncbi:hypothetical protein D3C71_1772430 [compost metagenome]